ncbi:MAG: SPOR domain-containing protein [Wenzhouxiangellaceae bacterium]
MDQALKQRLIGASILIALAVIFLPMLLDDPVEDAPSSELELRPRPQPPVETRRIAVQPNGRAERNQPTGVSLRRPEIETQPAPLTPPPMADRDQSNGQTDVATAPADETLAAADSESADDEISRDDEGEGDDTVATTADSSSTNTAAASEQPSERSARTDTASSRQQPVKPAVPSVDVMTPTPIETTSSGLIPDDQWSLQVASFSATDNASRLARRLREMGFNPNLDTVYRGGSPLHRVRVGPFSNQQSASAAAERISAAITDVRPRPIAPEGETAATAPATTQAAAATSDGELDRYAVQLGSFASEDNADRLLTRVREAGYSAFLERLDRDQGTRYLVKVGPLLSRDDASATRDRIDREMGIKGLLTEYL